MSAARQPTVLQHPPLDGPHRHWPETNCAVDLWLSALQAWGEQPLALPGFAVALDFEGDQFTFLKPPPGDLQALYGITVEELQLFRDMETHLLAQQRRGTFAMIEADGYWLPDTRGTGYRSDHAKTTIGVLSIEPEARRLRYLHNRTQASLEGEDYDGVLWRRPAPPQGWLPPYVEIARRDRRRARPKDGALASVAVGLLRMHLERAPQTNPVQVFGETLGAELPTLHGGDPTRFHRWAFATVRQLGAGFELIGLHAAWLGATLGRSTGPVPELCAAIAEGAKILQFRLARAAARGGDGTDCLALIETLARNRDRVISALRDHLG